MGGNISLNRGEGLLLKSVSIDSQGKADETLVSGAKAIASIAGAFAGVPSVDIDPSALLKHASRSPTDSDINVMRSMLDEADETPINCANWLIKILQSKGFEGTEEFSELQNYTLVMDSEASLAVLALPGEQARIRKLEQIIQKQESLIDELSGDDFVEVSEKIKLLKLQLTEARNRLAAFKADFANRQENFKKALGIGKKEKSESKQAVFKASQLPTYANFKRSGNNTLKSLGVAVTLDPLTTPNTTNATVDSDTAFIAYRDSSPYLMRVIGLEHPEDPNNDYLNKHEIKVAKVANLFSDTGSVAKIAYETSAFGDRKMVLNFSDGGTLLNVDYTFSSSREAMANAALNGAKGALTKYKSSLETMNAIRQAKRDEELAGIQLQIDRVNKRKALLDAELALVSADSAIESTLELQELNAELQRLTVEQQILTQNAATSTQASTIAINLLACSAIGIHPSALSEELPYYKEASFTPYWLSEGNVNLETFHKIPPFRFTDQSGEEITHEDFSDKVYVAGFFFSTCPGICPSVRSKLGKVQDEFADIPDVKIVQYSIRPSTDTVEVLQAYAQENGIDNKNWFLLAGNKSDIYSIAKKAYFASEDLGNMQKIKIFCTLKALF